MNHCTQSERYDRSLVEADLSDEMTTLSEAGVLTRVTRTRGLMEDSADLNDFEARRGYIRGSACRTQRRLLQEVILLTRYSPRRSRYQKARFRYASILAHVSTERSNKPKSWSAVVETWRARLEPQTHLAI